MTVFLQGAGGRFDQPLIFQEKEHAWSFPDKRDGVRLSDSGIKLLEHDVKVSAENAWTIDLLLQKQHFETR
jgi:hypothetical protein